MKKKFRNSVKRRMQGVVHYKGNVPLEKLLEKNPDRCSTSEDRFTKSQLRKQNQSGNFTLASGKRSCINTINYTLLFGKYIGVHISKVPKSYLEWMLKNIELRAEEINIVRWYSKN